MPEPSKRRQAARSELDFDPVKLRARRIAYGLGVVELADKAKFSPSYLSELERGNRNPSPGLLKRIAVALECETTDLMPDRLADAVA